MPRKFNAPIRVALLGYGLGGSAFHAPFIATTPGLRLDAVVTRDPHKKQSVSGSYPNAKLFDSAEEVFANRNDFDLVVIATPNDLHCPLALEALERGFAVVIDKPMAANSADCENLIAAGKRTGNLLSVFHNRRWDSDFLTVRKILNQGLLGEVFRFESRFDRWRPAPKSGTWRENADPANAGGFLFDLGSHLIDQAVTIFGAPSTVYAEVDIRRPGAVTDDDCFVALGFDSGVKAHLWMSALARIPGPRFRVRGTRGSFEKYGTDPQEELLKLGEKPVGEAWGAEPESIWGTLTADIKDFESGKQYPSEKGDYHAFYAGIADALQNGKPAPVLPEEALMTIHIIEAAQRSAREKSVVTFRVPALQS